MQCSKPKTIFLDKQFNYHFKNIDYFSIKSIDEDIYIDYFPAPCRKCYNCKQNRITFWNNKLNLELFESKVGVYATLTFDEEHLQEFSKECYQKYIKRLRKAGLKFKYFIVAELGGNTLRPHFHCIFFGLDVEHFDIIEKKWNCGFTDLKPLEARHFGYLINYLFKDNLFLSYSKELGYKFYDSNAELGYFYQNGYQKQLPPYYSKKYLSEDNQLLREDRIKQFFLSQENIYRSKYGDNWKNLLQQHLRQQNINLGKMFEMKNMI